MGYGIKVSKAGFDVLTTGNANLSFSSDLATHSIHSIVDASISAAGNPYVTITHSLGYIPKVWIFLVETVGEEVCYRRIPIDGWMYSNSIDFYITSTTIKIEAEDTATSYTFRVVIFTRSPNI